MVRDEPAGPTGDRSTVRLFERCEALPADPPRGDYVVIDTFYFSNTVVELLANGARAVQITNDQPSVLLKNRSDPSVLIGGEPREDCRPKAGCDLINSPSFVEECDVAGRTVRMTSANGGRTVTTLERRIGPQTSLFVGSTMNAAAVGTALRHRSRSTYLVCCGSRGEFALEDYLGALLIGRYLLGVSVDPIDLDVFRSLLKTAGAAASFPENGRRRRDVTDYAMDINSRAVVPKVEEGTTAVSLRAAGGAGGEIKNQTGTMVLQT